MKFAGVLLVLLWSQGAFARVLNCRTYYGRTIYTFYGKVDSPDSVMDPQLMEDFTDIDNVNWVPVRTGQFQPLRMLRQSSGDSPA